MDATEFCALTEEAVAELLADRAGAPSDAPPKERRAAPRWPFPGTAELWVPDETGEAVLQLATCLNLSRHGIGIKADFELPPGLELTLAIHQPEVSFHGRGRVRHCNEIEAGYYIGLEFLFDTE